MKYFENEASLALASLLKDQTVATHGKIVAGDQEGAIFYIKPPQSVGDNDVLLANSNVADYQGSFNEAIKKEPGYDDIQSIIDSAVSTAVSNSWPIGSVFNYTIDDTNPSVLLGFGTWIRYGEGRVIVSQTDGDTSFDTVGETGGIKEITLTEDQMPIHSHTTIDGKGQIMVWWAGDSSIPDRHISVVGGAEAASYTSIETTGGSAPHDNMPPYIVTYQWVRTA